MGDVKVSFVDGWSVLARVEGLDIEAPRRGRVLVENLDVTLPFGSLVSGNVRPKVISANGVTLGVEELPPMVRSGSRAGLFRSQLESLSARFRAAGVALTARSIDTIKVTNIKIGGPAIEKTGLFPDRFLMIPNLTWRPAGDDRALRVQIESDQGEWQLELTPGRDDQGLEFTDIRATEFSPAVFFPRIADPAKRPYYDAKLTMESRVLSDADGAFRSARALVSFGPGYLSMLNDDATIIDRIDIALELAADSEGLTLPRGDVRLGSTHIAYRGAFDLSAFGKPMTFDIEVGPSRLAPYGSDREPVIVDAGRATGFVDLGAGIIQLEDAVIGGKEGQVRAAGEFRWTGVAPGLSGAVTIGETTTRMARALWIPVVANKTRSWFDRNVKSGLLGPGTVQISLPMQNLGPAGRGRPLPPDGVIGSVPYQYAQFTPLRDLPLVRNAFGTLKFADATVTVELERADVSAGRFGVANVGPTQFMVPNLGRPNPVGFLNMKLTGPAAAVANLSNAGRLSIAEDRGIVPDVLSGDAEVDLNARFSLTKPTRAENIDAEFKLKLADFASGEPIRGQIISGGDLMVQGNVRSYTVNGVANIDGIPADIDLSLGSGEHPSTVKLKMDAEARQKLGIRLESFISGDVIASVDPSADQDMQEISVDLTPAQIMMPFAGWQKGAGVSANFSTTIDRTGEGTKLRNVVVEGDGFKATAEVEIGANGSLVRLDAKDISLKPGDRFNVLVEGDGEGYRIAVTGVSFDARGLIDQFLASADDNGFDDGKYEIALDLEQVRGFNDVSLGGLSGTISASGGRIRKLSLKAATGTEQPLQMIAEESDEKRLLELTSGNGGGLLRFLNVYTKAYGGDLRFRFAGTSQAGAGSLLIDNFRVQNEQVLSEAAKERAYYVDADREVRSTDITIDTTNLHFGKLHIPFTKADGIVTVNEASLRGPTVGASGRGTIDLKGQNLALSGTIVPAYGVNNIPGAIPILGQLLGGRKREGLIGITYKLFGPLKSPTLKLNPASAIAPGIFRRIFEFN